MNGINDKKNSFLIQKQWKEQIAFLSDEQRGKLLWAMFEYQCGGNDFETDDILLKVIWATVKQVFEYNDEKYLEICEKNRENAKKRWKNDATASERMQTDAKNADKDKDKDNDKEIDNDIDNDVENDNASQLKIKNINLKFNKEGELIYDESMEMSESNFEILKERIPPDVLKGYFQKIEKIPDCTNRYLMMFGWSMKDGYYREYLHNKIG